jgi:ABC-2 type transport system permease protein
MNMALATFYWPLLDVLIWGFLGAYIQNIQIGVHNYQAIALLGILLWQITSRGAIVIATSFVEELWSYNLMNLISLPLSLAEWMCGIVLYNIFTTCLSFTYCIGLIYLFYGLSPLMLFSKFVIFAPPLFISGLAIGFTCLAIIAYFGKRAQELCFVFSWFFSPFSTAFYPREILPAWAQAISDALPMSYVFTGMRASMMHNGDPMPYLIKSYLLSIAYLILAILAFAYMFNKSKKHGLARLSD